MRRLLVRTDCLPVAPAASTAIATAATTSATTPASASAGTTTTSTASPTKAAAPATAARTTAASTAISRRTRFVDHNASPLELLPVQRLDGALGFFIILNFNKAEATRLAREAIANQHDAGWSYSGLREPFSDFFFGSLKRKIPDVKFLH